MRFQNISPEILSTYTFTTRLHDIDAAGFMFYARSFYYLHDAYEAMLNEHEIHISDILESQYLLPVTHAEADFKAPVKLDQIISIDIFSETVKDDRFSLRFDFKDEQGKTRITALSRHVCINKQSLKATKLPPEWIKMLACQE